MKRSLTKYLIKWKNRASRKPIILRGARQVGKTYLVEDFGKNHFNNYIKINFEENPNVKEFFETYDIEQIISNIELFTGQKIEIGKTLIFLDEIQNCPKSIVALRYFYVK